MRRVATWTPDPLRFPRFPLLDGPSPLQPLTGFSGALGDRAGGTPGLFEPLPAG